MLFVFLQMKIPVGVDSFPSTSSSMSSTPGAQAPPTLGQDTTDEPIHIINVSLQYEDLEGSSDIELSKKCYEFVQVHVACDWHACTCDSRVMCVMHVHVIDMHVIDMHVAHG